MADVDSMDLEQKLQFYSARDEELKEKAKQHEEYLRSNPFYKPRPPRQGQGAKYIDTKLEKQLETMKLEHNKVNDRVQKLEEELDNLTTECEIQSTSDKLRSEEMKTLVKDCENLEKWKPSSKDEQILKDLKLRYHALRNLTQVKFDHKNCTEDTIKGYVFNSSKTRLKYFSVDKSSLSQDEVTSRIIGLMDKALEESDAAVKEADATVKEAGAAVNKADAEMTEV